MIKLCRFNNQETCNKIILKTCNIPTKEAASVVENALKRTNGACLGPQCHGYMNLSYLTDFVCFGRISLNNAKPMPTMEYASPHQRPVMR